MSVETASGSYTSDNIKTLKDAAHIRQNPGMYVGNTDTEGLHHLVFEIIYNSVDEALAGYCKVIACTIHVDGSITVADDGRGIPVDIKPETGKSTLEEVLTIAGTSGKFDNSAYRVSAGLHGMGAKAMNALSEWCEAVVRRGGRVYKMEFEKGYASSELQNVGPAPDGQTGTEISFKPDPEIFGQLTFDYDKLATRFRQIAYLNGGLKIAIQDDRDGKAEEFFSERGIAEYVEYLNTGEAPEHLPILMKKAIDGIEVEVCIQYTNADDKKELCFTNNAYNKDGGTHLSGFRTGLTRSVTNYGKKDNLFKEMELKGEDFREGLTAVISVSHPDPSFESQTKVKLTSPEVDGVVASVVYETLSEYLEKNPKDGIRICKKIALAAEARIAAKKARDAIIDRKKILGGGGLPGKLMDCTTRERMKSELFLVEGDSAGGSAESGRDRYYQAVLPLRGKVLNVEKARLEKLLKNEEIASLIAAVGVDIGNTEEIAKVRYGKIVILTDADVDGQHIRTLLLTFFFRQMRKLVEAGYIYVARPPLFKVTQKKEVRFVKTREDMARELMSRGMKETTIEVAGPSPRTISGEAIEKLMPILDDVEAAAVILERRGQPFGNFLALAQDGVLPIYHCRAAKPEFVHDLKQLDEAQRPNADEWHEVRSLNKALVKLKEMGFGPADLVPLPRIAGREPAVRFTLIHGDSRQPLEDLRGLTTDIRRLGEKGMTITRFKGLGEMDPDELWETTLDPEKRILLRVTLADAIQAEKMFRTLMGDDVEGRREYILKNRIGSIDDIDYGA
jgi:DNA gyrase subunit B